jgi:hypothetical protein
MTVTGKAEVLGQRTVSMPQICKQSVLFDNRAQEFLHGDESCRVAQPL